MLNDVSCGMLTVLTRHGDPSAGTIQVFVTRIEPGVPQPAADPVLSLGGDLGVAPDYETLGPQAVGLGREVIVMNVRGTGRSQPSLVCPEVDALATSPVAAPVDDPGTRSEFLDAVAACHDRLVSQGVDLAAFDLHEMAADAEDLRAALGIARWDIMTIGTSSRIALEYLREFPDHVRAAVLDSPEWPGVDPFVESVEATQHATQELVADCAADAVCDRIAPDLGHEIKVLDRRLQATPRVEDFRGGGQVLFDAGWFQVWLRARLSFQRLPSSFVPHAIRLLTRGSERVLRRMTSALVEEQLCQGFLPNCWDHLVLGFGAYLSVVCRDVLPFTDRSSLMELAGNDPGLDEAFVRSPFLEACNSWDVPPGDPLVAMPLTSDVPVLVLVGRFDPFGMLPYARAGVLTLSNADVLVSPVNGHQVTGPKEPPDSCMVRVRDAWLDDPQAEPDASCVDRLELGYGLPPRNDEQ
jgi:pimeloyl-ACP methyl ester carboxylesterase